jgi:NTP pyrophosphatase (non-canonical NTP hydrolase)
MDGREDFLTQLRRVNTERYIAWIGVSDDAGIMFDALELGGEVGELLNVVKKLDREERGWRGSRAAPADFAAECADVLICLDKLARRKGVDLVAATIEKFNATSEKVDLPHRLAASTARPTERGAVEDQADRDRRLYEQGRRDACEDFDIPTGARPTNTRRADREALRREIINTPETADFMSGVPLEAMHQRERWGSDHDAGKTPEDWFWLIGYLAQKALRAQNAGDLEKAQHHTISTAAALANWHAALAGADTSMRPGIIPPAAFAEEGQA